MSTKGWIIAGLGVGVVVAILLGVFAQSETVAQKEINPSTTSKESLQSTFASIQSNWDAVKSDASKVLNLNTDKLQDDWNTYLAQVRQTPDNATPSDIKNNISQATEALTTEVQNTVGEIDCSTS
jgi:hypothetical protein